VVIDAQKGSEKRRKAAQFSTQMWQMWKRFINLKLGQENIEIKSKAAP